MVATTHIQHGRSDAYSNHGCRCLACRAWKRESSAKYRKKDNERFKAQRRAEYAANPERFLKVNRRAAFRRLRILDRYKVLLGCAECGFRKHPAALEFHHRDPNEKAFIISQNATRSWSRVKAEVRKCDILCANCHAIFHAVRLLGGRHGD